MVLARLASLTRRSRVSQDSRAERGTRWAHPSRRRPPRLDRRRHELRAHPQPGATAHAPSVIVRGIDGIDPPVLERMVAAYHPSQQNTQTGRVTPAMYRRVLREVRRALGPASR